VATPFVSYTRDERVYFLLETAYGITPNGNGISNLDGGDAASIISLELDPDVDLYDSEYKTGSRSIAPGQPGRRIGHFRMSLPLKGSGTPGVPSDYDPVLISAFGNNTVNAGNSVVYSIVDNPAQTFSIFRFRTPAQLFQQCGISCIPTRSTWTLGQNMANWSCEGDCMWVLDSENFATEDPTAQAGLTVFPVEPTNPIVNGVQSQGFVGSLLIDGQSLVNIQTMTIQVDWGWTQNRTFFGSFYPTGVLGGTRRVTCTMEAFDDSSAAMQDLRSKGISKATMSCIATIGATPGNIHSFNLNNLQIDYPRLIDSGDRFGLRWGALVAHESSPAARDEFTYTCR
jgi:hypothetical protein